MSLLLELKQCRLGYHDADILTNFSWQVQRGERWAVVGPNGAGKTTLIRSLLGLIPLLDGRLDFFSTEGNVLTTPLNIGYLPQINNIDKTFPISVREVILSGLYGLNLSKAEENERIEQLIQSINLTEHQHTAIGHLSGGQLQRTLLARALASQPELLILDEPTSFLDKNYKSLFIQLLNRLTSTETTIIMVTHDLPKEEEDQWQILSIGQF